MSFWEDASPIVKGAIVFGIIGIIIATLVLTGVIGGTEAETTGERGLQPASEAAD